MPVGQSGHYIGSFNMFRLRPLKTNFYKLRLKSAKLNFGTFRLLLGETNDELWHWDDPDILEKLQRVLERDLLPFSKQMSDPLNFIEYAELFRANNSQTLKAIGFTQVKLGQKNLAIKTFEELISLPIHEYGTKWQNELKDQARSIVMLLKETPDAASAQLSKWEDEAIEALKLQKFKV